MTKAFTALVFGLFAASQLAVPAAASDPRVNELLNKLEQATKSDGVPSAALVTRNFTLLQKVTLALPEGPNCPCYATGSVSQFAGGTLRASAKTIKLVRQGNVCMGTIRHRIRWVNADDAANVGSGVTVFTKCGDALDPVNVTVNESGAPFPLPAENGTKSQTYVMQD